MNIKTYKKVLDKQLRPYIKKKIIQAQKVAAWPRPQQIIAYLEDSIFAWWKRVRPYLIYLWYKLYGGGQDAEVIRFSGAAELIHTLALIHDDIIDKGDMRHNKPCVHTFASDLIASTNKDHLWVSQAILAGDLTYAWAYDVLYSSYTLPQQALYSAQKNMQTMIEEVVAWQMIDVDTMTWDHVDIEKLEAKNHYKTGQYTFTRPMVTWALLAGADKKVCTQLEKIGTLLGKAYQMRDDILDVTIADGDDTSHYDNKTKFSDIQDGQQTYLTNYIYDNGSYAHRLAISKAMWKRLAPQQISELRTVFVESGAIAYGKTLLDEYLDKATVLIKKLSVPNEAFKKHLYEIIELLHTI